MKLTQANVETVGRILSKNYGIRVICKGNKCCTDGKSTIWLPALPDTFESMEVLGLVRSFLDHEVGHLIAESKLELVHKMTKEHGVKAMSIYQVLDDARAEDAMRKIYIGSGINLDSGMDYILKKFQKIWDEDDQPDLKEKLKNPLKQFTLGIFTLSHRRELPSFTDKRIVKLLAKHRDRIVAIPQWAPTHKSLWDFCVELHKEYSTMFADAKNTLAQQQQSKGKQQEDEQGDVTDSTAVAEDDSQPPEKNEPKEDKGDDKKDDSGASTEKGKGEKGDENNEKNKVSDGDSEPDDDEIAGEDDDVDDEEDNCGDGEEKREDDEDAGLDEDFSADYDNEDAETFSAGDELAEAVEEEIKCGPKDGPDKAMKLFRPISKDIDHEYLIERSPFVKKFTQTIPNAIDRLPQFRKATDKAGGPCRQRLSQLLQSEDKVWYRGGQQRGIPDPRNIAALAAGISDRVMRRKFETESHNTAVYLLIDGSESMGWDGRSDNNGILPIEHACRTAAAFVSVLEPCGHSVKSAIFQVYDTCGNFHDGREKHCPGDHSLRMSGVDLLVVKPWHEKLTSCWQRFSIGCGVSWGATPLGEALWIAAKDLNTRPEKRLVLMAVTDGEPNNPDYTKYIIPQIEKMTRIEVVLIGVGEEVKVENLHNKYAYAHEPKDLGTTCMTELTKVLKLGIGKGVA